MMGGWLRRPLEIHQGIGSVLYVLPDADSTVDGGRVRSIERRELRG
jgi:hypothetical protein